MTKQFNLSISVSTNADISGVQVAEILKRLIDAGLSDALETIESGEGDLESAKLATDLTIAAPYVMPQETSVKVRHWDAYSNTGATDTHQFDIDDQRYPNGQAFVTVGSLEGNLDDMLSVSMEVNANPLSGGGDHVPCAHIHFDGEALAVSLFKIGDRILVRPEVDVSIQPFSQSINGICEELYWIE